MPELQAQTHCQDYRHRHIAWDTDTDTLPGLQTDTLPGL